MDLYIYIYIVYKIGARCGATSGLVIVFDCWWALLVLAAAKLVTRLLLVVAKLVTRLVIVVAKLVTRLVIAAAKLVT